MKIHERFVRKVNWISLRVRGTFFNYSANGPDFLIIGAQKAGTTSLFKYVAKYTTNFSEPRRKEIYYYTRHHKLGLNWYKANFPKVHKGNLTGEATPDYLFYHLAPQRIFNDFPNIKLVVILRDPIERAFSQFNFQNRRKNKVVNNNHSFKEAIEIELEQIEKGLNPGDVFSTDYAYRSYVRRGIYIEQLKRWRNYFHEKQFCIIESNELFNNTNKTLNEVFAFLELQPKSKMRDQFEVHNKSIYNETIEKDVLERLKEFYKPYNEELFDFLGKKYHW
jgi:hypothetical protein